MGLDIYFAEDIRNALLAANEASSSTAMVCAAVGSDEIVRAYLEGYGAALNTVALAFGLAPTFGQQGGNTLIIPTKGVYHDKERDDPQPTGGRHSQLVGRSRGPGSGLR